MTIKRMAAVLLLLSLAFLFTACAGNRGYSRYRSQTYLVKDNKPQLWVSDHPEVRKFRAYYMRTRTVKNALRNSRKFLPAIGAEFRRRRLPMELAYLPMLESLFANRADSGSAKGMWQFTPQTAREMGLRIGLMVDERLNWRKATAAAAKYLDQLGAKFNYNWALALAAYNGGPNYVAKEMRRQGSWDYWQLRLRKETAEYVPRFIAMLQVAKEKYPEMMVAGR